jgi:TRAP-type C4-dicarboxylate transport system substrate-binding protein
VGLGSIGLAELVKYRVEPKFYNLANVVLISNEKWSSLPAEARKIIEKVAKEYELASVQEMITQNKADIDVANKAGVKALVMSGENEKKYLKIAEDAMWDVVAKKIDPAEARRLRGIISK